MFTECRAREGGLTKQQRIFVDYVLSGASRDEAKALAGYVSKPKSAKIDQAINGEIVGDFTERAKNYAFRLAVERMTGELMEEQRYETWEARRGHELEPDARVLHAQARGLIIKQSGFVTTDDNIYGASVDGLVFDWGISEYKCFVSPASIRPIIIDGLASKQMDQVQGGLWITGRKVAHFCLYCPQLESIGRNLTIMEFERDEEYISALKKDLGLFNDLVNKYINILKGG